MPQYRYTHEGVDHRTHDAKNLTEAFTRAGEVIRTHRVRSVDVDDDGDQYEVGLAQDLLLPDDVVAIPNTSTDQRLRVLGLTRAITPPPIHVTVTGHTVAELRHHLDDLDPHTEVRLASRYPIPYQAGFHPDGPFLGAAQDGSVHLCEGRILGDLPDEVTGPLGW